MHPQESLCCSKSTASETSRLQAEVRSLWYTLPRTTRSDDEAVSVVDAEPVLVSITRRTVVRAIRQSGVQQSAPRATRAASTTPVSYQLPMIRGSRVVPVQEDHPRPLSIVSHHAGSEVMTRSRSRGISLSSRLTKRSSQTCLFWAGSTPAMIQ